MIMAFAMLLFSCQRIELIEKAPAPGDAVSGEVTVSFSALVPSQPATKAMGDDPVDDMQTMHLVVFDENGMYVETREATLREEREHGTHQYERCFDVTLTISNLPRIIHFIGNCPLDQIRYGHESSIISNMYVEKSAEVQTAYWARIEVPYILVNEVMDEKGEVIGHSLVDQISESFQCVPMLRNYAQIVVRNCCNEFELESYAIYNTIDMGTVAPYNIRTAGFQSFVDENGEKYSYPDLMALQFPYEGHALAKTTLNTQLSDWMGREQNVVETVADQDGGSTSVVYEVCQPYYMYERKVSVRTDSEQMWDESPPHLIIKGKYGNSNVATYYKADLVYPKSIDGVDTYIYYNILRNFRYQFSITEVVGDGYATPEEAIKGATSNNLAGSATTTKFTNISDNQGRLWVSYTDTTLVNNNTISLKYKYIPDLVEHPDVINNDIVAGQEFGVAGGLIRLENVEGDVISDYTVASSDITSGQWAGYREITFTINEPSHTNKEQTLVVRTDKSGLSRDIRFKLKEPYPLQVQCVNKKVASELNAPVQVDIKVPIGLTEDMFPLYLDIEVYDMTLSPDVDKNTVSLPVEIGKSAIPLPEKQGQNTFHYRLTIETIEQYNALRTEGTQKIIETHWLTNNGNNQSTVYVVNKYIELAYDNFVNARAFNGSFSKTSVGISGTETVDYSFDIYEPLADDMTVTVTLDRLSPAASGSGLQPTSVAGVYTYTPASAGRQTIHLIANATQAGTCSVSISAADEYNYVDETDTIEQTNVVTISFAETAAVRLTTNRVNTLRSITVAGAEVTYESAGFGTTRYNNQTYYTVTFTNLVITGENINDDTRVTIVTSQGANGTQRTTNTTIGALRAN